MVSQEKILSYVESLIYYIAKPAMSEQIAASFETDSLPQADTGAQLLILGALLTTGRFDEFSQLTGKLDFGAHTAEERSQLAHCIFTTFSETLLANYATSSRHAAAILQLLTVISPESILAHRSGCEPPAGQALIELDYAQQISPSVSGAVFSRENSFGPGSRKSEFGYRIQSSLASQGWNVALLPLKELFSYAAPCRQDFVLVDVGLFWKLPPLDQLHELLAYLKRHFRKVIIFEPDPWTGFYDQLLRSIADRVDYIWGFTPDWDLTQDPCYRNKSIMFPNVGGFEQLAPPHRHDLDWSSCSFNFTGSVQGYNLNRVYWILEAIRLNLPLEVLITNPGVDDGLDCESSLKLYIQKLLSSHASLNLATRKDGSRMLTGRAVEVISLNRLLIQECCPALRRYYVEGEHFLEFKEIEGLASSIHFLESHPRVAQTICSQGYQFYLERYSCRKMVEHIQTLL